jgi:uncharacterized lipoprotein YajG
MTHYRFLPVVHNLGRFVVLVAIALAGCSRSAEPVANTPVADTPSQSAEYPTVTPTDDSKY